MGAKANGRWESDRPHAVAVSARELRAGELGHPPDDVDRVASAAMHPATMFPFFSPKKEGARLEQLQHSSLRDPDVPGGWCCLAARLQRRRQFSQPVD